MAELKDKIENALNEARTLILGAEVLLGFDYQSVFQAAFEKLPPLIQGLRIAGLALMLIVLALLMAPSAFHQLAARGEDTPDLHRFTTYMAGIALLPFGCGIAVDCLIAVEPVAGLPIAMIGGVLALAVALFFWYGLELIDRRTYGQQAGDEKPMAEGTPLNEKFKQVMVEIRIVVPGVQALLGFQFAVILIDGFDKLPEALKYVHLASLACIAISTVLLMTPAAYHRIVERGEDSEHFLHFASRMLIAAMAFLAPGVAGDFLVVVDKITKSTPWALVSAVMAMVVFYGLWFGYTVYRRNRMAG